MEDPAPTLADDIAEVRARMIFEILCKGLIRTCSKPFPDVIEECPVSESVSMPVSKSYSFNVNKLQIVLLHQHILFCCRQMRSL